MTFLLDVLSLISFALLLQSLLQLKRDWRGFWDDVVTKKDQLLAQRLAIFALLPLGVLLHEIGHAIATWQSGGTVAAFQWRFMWGYIIPKGNFSPFQNWWIALGGNLISFLLVAVTILLIPRVRKRIVAEILFFFACAQAITSLIAYPLLSITRGFGDWPTIYNLSFQPYAIITLFLHVCLVVALWRLYRSDKALRWRLARNPGNLHRFLSLRSEVGRNPAHLPSCFDLANLLVQQNELWAAKRIMRNLPQESSQERSVQLVRAFLAASTSPRKAINLCQPLLAADLSLAEQIILDRTLGFSHLQLGKLTTALGHADHGLSLAPDQPNLLGLRATIHHRLRQIPDARADLEAAITHAETDDMRWGLQEWQKQIEPRTRPASQPLELQHMILAGLGFLPLLGLPFSLITVVWGFFLRKEVGAKLMILGVLGPFLSLAALVGAVSFFQAVIFRSPSIKQQQSVILMQKLSSTAAMIEDFKKQSGGYPANLKDLNESARYLIAYDDTQPSQGSGGFVRQPTFFYQRVSTPPGYYLFSVGQDGKPFTPDDVLPPLSPEVPGLRHPPKR
jgi:tetratricopeptide (TPR) repeat protein